MSPNEKIRREKVATKEQICWAGGGVKSDLFPLSYRSIEYISMFPQSEFIKKDNKNLKAFEMLKILILKTCTPRC